MRVFSARRAGFDDWQPPSTVALHSITWLVWAAAALLSLAFVRDPLYVLVIIIVSAITVELQKRPSNAMSFSTLVGVGIFFAVLRICLTTATTHGVGDAWFTLPQFELPVVFGGFTVGGTVEQAVVLQSAAEGLLVVGILAIFGALNSLVSHSELIKFFPRPFYEFGVILVVALTFVPSTIASFRSARQADLARTGGRLVKKRKFVRNIVTVVETGLEKGVYLAESMDSRGFGAKSNKARTQYRKMPMRSIDGIAIVAALLIPAAIFLLTRTDAGLQLHSFDPLIGLCLLGLSVPAVLPLFSRWNNQFESTAPAESGFDR